MKKINILLLALVSLMLFSCEDDDKLTINSEITPPVLNALTPENFDISTMSNIYDKIAYWTWTAPDYGFDASVEYTVQADVSATFENAFTVGSVKARSIAITGEMLNKAGMAFAEESEPLTLYVRLKAAIAADENQAYAPETYSNIQIITFTPSITQKLQKAAIYIMGSLVNGVPEWNDSLGNGLQVFFSDNSLMDEKVYSYTGTFNGGSIFKIRAQAASWDGAYTYSSAGVLIGENKGSDIPGPSTAGIYTLTVDLTDLTYKFTPYTGETTTYNTIGIVGDATAGGWDNDTQMEEVTPHVWVLAEADLTVGELKFRAEKGWDINWGGTDTPFGIGPKGGDNIAIEKSGKYFIAFNDLTGQYIVYPKDIMP